MQDATTKQPILQVSGLTYTWDSSKQMTNCAFAIVRMTYSANANLTGLQATKFQLTSSPAYFPKALRLATMPTTAVAMPTANVTRETPADDLVRNSASSRVKAVTVSARSAFQVPVAGHSSAPRL